MNSLFALTICKKDGVWAFDDPARNLYREPFVSGSDTLLEMMNDRLGMNGTLSVIFSDVRFPDFDIRLNRAAKQENIGTWYYCPQLNLDCWLCPALNKYFTKSPETIYVKFNKTK